MQRLSTKLVTHLSGWLLVVSSITKNYGEDELFRSRTSFRLWVEIDSKLHNHRLDWLKDGLATVRVAVTVRSNFNAVEFIDVGKIWSKASGTVQLHFISDQANSQPTCVENPNARVNCILQLNMIGATHHSKIVCSSKILSALINTVSSLSPPH